MALLDQVVVGVDGSEGAKRALAWALAQAPTGQVDVVHCFPPRPEFLAVPIHTNIDSARAEHLQLLNTEWTGTVDQGEATVTTELVNDSPASGLLAASSRRGQIPIVIGHQGHGRWATHLVGDQASRLLHLASVPLIMINRTSEATPVSGSVAVCVHGAEQPSNPAVHWALQMASEKNLPLRVLSVALPPAAGPGYGYSTKSYDADKAQLLDQRQQALDQLVAELTNTHPTVETSGQVISGHPTEKLAELLSGSDTGLAVIGNHHHSKLGSFLAGGVARHLPPLVDCPVVAIPVP